MHNRAPSTIAAAVANKKELEVWEAIGDVYKWSAFPELWNLSLIAFACGVVAAGCHVWINPNSKWRGVNLLVLVPLAKIAALITLRFVFSGSHIVGLPP